MPETRHRTVLEIGVDDRALRQLAPTMERALNPKVAEAFEKSMERSTTAISKMVEQQAKLGKLLDEQAKRAQGRQRDDDRRRRDEDRRMRDAARSGTAQGSMMGTLGAHALMRGNQLAGQMPYQEGFLSQMLSAIPILGPAFGGAVGGAMSFYQSFAQRQIARARAFGATGLGGRAYGSMGSGGYGLGAAGVELGYGPSELPGLLSGYAQSSGMRGYGLGTTASRALQLQALGGIDMSASGSLANSMLTGTTGSGTSEAEDRVSEMLTEAVAAGITAGIREGRIGEMLQQISGAVTQLRTQGIMLDVGETISLMRGLSGLGGGFGGEAGTAAATSITRGFAGAADREGVMSALAIRNRMSSTGEDYETAARSIESSPVEAFRSVMGTLGRFRGTRGFETMLRSQFERMGINLSRDQAHRLANMSPEELSAMTGPTSGAEDLVTDFLGHGREVSEDVMSTASTEAGYESSRASLGGGRLGSLALDYRDLEMRMIRAFAPAASAFGDAVVREVSGLFGAFQEGGMAGLLERAMSRVVEGLRSLGDALLGPDAPLPDAAGAGDVTMDLIDTIDWALGEAAEGVLRGAGAEGAADWVSEGNERALERGAARRRGLAESSTTSDSAVMDAPGGAVRVETTTTVTPVGGDLTTGR